MVLIIGYGNPLRGDDAVGHVAAARLAKLYDHDAVVDVLSVQQLTPDLAEKVAQYDLIILVDARLAAPPGQVIIEEVTISPRISSPTFSHHVKPQELKAITQAIYSVSPGMMVASISSESFEVGSPLTQKTEIALVTLIERIKTLIHNYQLLE